MAQETHEELLEKGLTAIERDDVSAAVAYFEDAEQVSPWRRPNVDADPLLDVDPNYLSSAIYFDLRIGHACFDALARSRKHPKILRLAGLAVRGYDDATRRFDLLGESYDRRAEVFGLLARSLTFQAVMANLLGHAGLVQNTVPQAGEAYGLANNFAFAAGNAGLLASNTRLWIRHNLAIGQGTASDLAQHLPGIQILAMHQVMTNP